MNVLGISAYYHDSAAALIRDGEIVAAAQEERFNRRKQYAGFPTRAAQWCLEEAGLTGKDVDYVAFYDKPFLKFERLLETYLAFAPRGFKSFRLAMPIWIGEKLFQKNMLGRELKELDPDLADPAKLLFAEHHFSHAASAFFPSPFEEAAVLTIDGVGEWSTTTAGVGRGADLKITKEIHFPHSLGLLYAALTYYTGFKVNSDEYKVMGLAPYGEPTYAQMMLDHLIDLKPDGSFRLNLDYFDYCTGLTMTNARFDALFGAPPRKSDERIGQRHMDLAASIQAVTEEAVLRLTRSIAAETGMANLCLAGGVALNCVANGKVLRDGRFRDIWIQPAAGDAGGALGAALAAYHLHLQRPRHINNQPDGMKGAFLGPAFSAEQIHAGLRKYQAVFKDIEDDQALLDEVVSALVDQKVIGWFQGRMEFGPRALGNRSILGDARSPKLQRQLNLSIKYRESFRPFAPAVSREDVSDYFELDSDSPYMLVVANVKADRRIAMTDEQQALQGIDKLNVPRSDIPAVTHIDYSARVQTVHAATNERFHGLLGAMRARTGTGVLVNTSFNVRDEPVVCTPEDAYRCFMATEMDLLVVGNTVLRKEEQLPPLAQGTPLGDALIPSRLLACMKPPGAANDAMLERVDGAFRCPRTGASFLDQEGIPSLLSGVGSNGSDQVTGRAGAHDEERPFPTYDGVEDFGELVTRGWKNSFANGLLEAIGYNKLVLECGCGTGQLSHFLSLNNNHVLGVDVSLAGLKLAVEHKVRNNVPRAAFVQMNVLDLGVKDGTFDVVIGTGLPQHTRDARSAFASIVRKAKPGGLVLVGLSNSYSRLPTWVRSKLWPKDQHHNPPKTWHSIDEVMAWFRENDVSYVNCQPAILGAGGNGMFTVTNPGSASARMLTQLSWIGSMASEGAQFVMIGRRNS